MGYGPTSPTSPTSQTAVTRDDFRIRRTGDGFRVWQHVGNGWEPLTDVHPTREDARAWITAAVARVA